MTQSNRRKWHTMALFSGLPSNLLALLLELGAAWILIAPASGAAAGARPSVTGKVIAVHSAATAITSVAVYGSGFGFPARTASIQFKDQLTRSKWRTLPSLDARVRKWEPSRILCDLPGRFSAGQIRIRTRQGISAAAGWSEAYEYSSYPLPVSPHGEGNPLAVQLSDDGRLWINQEFHTAFFFFDPQANRVSSIPSPGRATKPFGMFWNGADIATDISSLGEEVMVDPQGFVWFSEGGGFVYGGRNTNRSRIIRFDPDAPLAEAYRVYLVPGDRNEVMGLAYDTRRRLVWFTQKARGPNPAKLIGFDPDSTPYLSRFSGEDLSGIEEFPLPSSADDRWWELSIGQRTYVPGHIAMDAEGDLWYSGFWGRGDPDSGQAEIGRVDPDTGSLDTFPLPRTIGQSFAAAIVGPGPWSMQFAANGDVVFNRYFDSTISRFDRSRLGDPACTELAADGANPCIRDFVLPSIDRQRQTLHSLVVAADQRVWFTLADEWDDSATPSTASVGYLDAEGLPTLLPPLAAFAEGVPFSGAGIAVGSTGEIWFAEFLSNRIGKLRRTQ